MDFCVPADVVRPFSGNVFDRHGKHDIHWVTVAGRLRLQQLAGCGSQSTANARGV